VTKQVAAGIKTMNLVELRQKYREKLVVKFICSHDVVTYNNGIYCKLKQIAYEKLKQKWKTETI